MEKKEGNNDEQDNDPDDDDNNNNDTRTTTTTMVIKIKIANHHDDDYDDDVDIERRILDSLQSSHCAGNCLQHVSESRAAVSLAACCEGTARPLSLYRVDISFILSSFIN